jgi:CO/xanthine dehydrogenase Mo-binding subunit
MADRSTIGTSLPRQDAWPKVLGQASYAVDYYGPDLVWAGVKRAGVPHARLRGLHLKAAQDVPGVIKILTHRDIPGTNRLGVVRRDMPVLVEEKIRYYGDALALVLAENPEALKEALDRLIPDLEPLPAVFDPGRAMEKGAPLLHEDHPDGNILLKGVLETGPGEDRFGEGSVIVEAEFQTHWQEHAYLETEAGWAQLESDGGVTLITSTQTPFRDRAEVAEALGLKAEEIRIIVPHCGGAFGGKDGITVQAHLALAARHASGRPVKMWWSREESLQASAKRHPVQLNFRLAAKDDGTFQALSCRLVYDTGPYDHLGGAVMALGLEHAPGPYRIPQVSLKAWAVYTNNPLGGPFRGFGVPQVTAAREQVVDMMAAKLGLSSLELRLKNALKAGEANPLGVPVQEAMGLTSCLETVRKHPLWKNKELWKKEEPPFKKRGVGLACVMHGQGYGPVIPDVARAKIEFTALGRFRIYSGVVDMGQGNSSTYAQMAGEILHQPLSRLELILPDTAQTLPCGSASASRTTYTFGQALIGAAVRMKERLLEKAGEFLHTMDPEALELISGGVRHRPTGWLVPLVQLSREFSPEERFVVNEFQAPVAAEAPTRDPALRLHGIPHLIFSYGIHLAAIEVDTLTGAIEVRDYLAVSDCGRIINPQIFEQQIQGGIVQGLGYALLEEFKAEKGAVKTINLSTYLIPTALDCPEMTSLAVEIPEPTGPFGLKGAGEISIDGPLPAVANALAEACGLRIKQTPLTPERVLRALRERVDGSGKMEAERGRARSPSAPSVRIDKPISQIRIAYEN